MTTATHETRFAAGPQKVTVVRMADAVDAKTRALRSMDFLRSLPSRLVEVAKASLGWVRTNRFVVGAVGFARRFFSGARSFLGTGGLIDLAGLMVFTSTGKRLIVQATVLAERIVSLAYQPIGWLLRLFGKPGQSLDARIQHTAQAAFQHTLISRPMSAFFHATAPAKTTSKVARDFFVLRMVTRVARTFLPRPLALLASVAFMALTTGGEDERTLLTSIKNKVRPVAADAADMVADTTAAASKASKVAENDSNPTAFEQMYASNGDGKVPTPAEVRQRGQAGPDGRTRAQREAHQRAQAAAGK